MDVIRWLGDLHRTDLAQAGGKATNLAELVRGGFPVPEAFVVTTAAYDAFVTPELRERIAQVASGVDVDSLTSTATAARTLAELLQAAPVPHDVQQQICQAYQALGSPPVAVRSSATAEDRAEASYAGQQETVLDVTSADELLAAVRRCWVSLWGERALAYRARLGADDGHLALAVVVQRLVPADTSGVMFTMNPVTGARDEVLVDAVRGLGEASVSGLVTPDTYVVRGSTVRVTRGSQSSQVVATGHGTEVRSSEVGGRVLGDAQVRELAALGQQVAERLGGPQDIEWAIAAGTVWLLQARPVTTAVDEPLEWPVPDPGGMYFRASIIEQLPDPLTPLFADMSRVVVPAGLRAVLAELGLDISGIRFVTINGYAYYEYATSALVEMLKKTPRLLPTLFGRRRRQLVESWRHKALPRYQAVVDRWDVRPVGTLSATELLAGASELLAAGCSYYACAQALLPQSAASEMLFQAAYEATARRRNDPAATTYLLGFDSQPLQAERDLYGLARWAVDRGLAEGLVAELSDTSGDAVRLAPEDWADWLERYQEYVDQHGGAVTNLDFANPLLGEDLAALRPTLLYFLTDPDGSRDPERRQRRVARAREEATRELLSRLGPLRRRLLGPVLRRAQEDVPLRENLLAGVGLGWPVLRRLLLTLGQRLVEEEVLAEPADVFWLGFDEATSLAEALDAQPPVWIPTATPRWPEVLPDLLAEAEVERLAARITERRDTWQRQRRSTPPGVLPRTWLLRLVEPWLPTNEQSQTGPVLKGLGASAGVVEGTARLVLSTADLASMQPGEILVASLTTPAFTPAFALAKAVVTDVGGLLSHSSVVAREYQIPAVLGTGTATRRITTGDRVRVDGTSGTVTLLDRTPTPAPSQRRPSAQTRRSRATRYAAAAALAGAGAALLRWTTRR